MFTEPQPVVIGQAALSGEFALPEQARWLAVVVHPDRASRGLAGHRFVADVLRANGIATLCVGLRTPAEETQQAAVPPPEVVAVRLRAMLAWLALHTATRPLQLGLVAVDAAVPACIAAGRQRGLDAIRAIVTIDGRPDLALAVVRGWRWPGLALVGRNTLRPKPRGRRPARGGLPSPHRVVRLAEQTWPTAEPGAFEAIACATTAWLQARVPQALLLPPGPLREVQAPPLRLLATGRRRVGAQGLAGLVLPPH